MPCVCVCVCGGEQVRQNGVALGFTADALRADKGLVLAAVAQDGKALWAAAPPLQNDREVVAAAVAQDGLALRFASAGLRADRAVVAAAVAQNPSAMVFADEAWWGDAQEQQRRSAGGRSPEAPLFPTGERKEARSAAPKTLAVKGRGLRATPFTRLEYAPSPMRPHSSAT